MLKHDDFCLRPLCLSDLKKVLEWRNSRRIRAVMYSDHKISEHEHYAWFKKICNDKKVSFFIFEVKGRRTGVLSFSQITPIHGTGHWGFYVGEKKTPKGTGMRLGYLALEVAFQKLNIRKVYGEALEFNWASLKFHRRLGFDEEGRLKKHIYKRGKYTDVVIFGLLKNKWLKNKKRLERICFHGR